MENAELSFCHLVIIKTIIISAEEFLENLWRNLLLSHFLRSSG